MLTKQQQRSLELLEEYFKETPAEEIQAGIDAVSKMKFGGPTVREYFDNFHLAYSSDSLEEEDSLNKNMKQKNEASKNKALLSEVKSLVQKEDPKAQIYLFGSRARKDHRQDSDWDFFVVTSKKDYRRFENKILDIVYDLMLKYDELIQVIAYPKSSWEKGHSPSPLYDNIRKEGVIL